MSADLTQAVGRLLDAESVAPGSDDEAALVQECRSRPVSDVLAEVRRLTAKTREDAAAEAGRGYVKLSRTSSGGLRLSGFIPAVAEAELVAKALTRVALAAPVDPDTGKQRPWEQRLVWALCELAAQALARDSDPNRATVVVHVRQGQPGHIGGHAIAEDTLCRLLCDCRIQVLIEDAHERLVAMTAVRRLAPPSLQRFIDDKTDGCEFPACDKRHGLFHYHHIGGFNGGNTTCDWVAKLCPFHHWLVHEGGWKLCGTRSQGFRWYKPGGVPYQPPDPSRYLHSGDAIAHLKTIVEDIRRTRDGP